MNEEEGKNLRIVAEVMTEAELCERCGEDTVGSGTKTFSAATGAILKILCHGCSDASDLEAYEKDRSLTNRVVMMAIMAKEPSALLQEVKASYERVVASVRSFERDVWFSGLQSVVRRCKSSGMSMAHEGLAVLLYSMAGRIMITIQDGVGDVTLIADETSKESTMGVQGTHSTESQAVDLIERATEAWNAGVRPTPDRTISPL